jgi:hypothetical protein
MRINYEKLMKRKPTYLGCTTNDLKQNIDFYEDPIHGDEAEVICVCHELQLAAYSSFFETSDMHGRGCYQPLFVDGELLMGFEYFD